MNNGYAWKLLGFDTDLFGFKTAKIETLTPTHVKTLVMDLQNHGIRYATYRIPANEFDTIHAMEQHGFVLVDGYVTMKCESLHHVSGVKANIREAQTEDIQRLKAIAGNIFVYSRFHHDPLIANDKADEVYASWIENSVKGSLADKVFAYEESASITGFVTLKNDGHIPFIGVSKEGQGKGISKKLIYFALNYFSGRGLLHSEIETQIQNIPALRTYISCGYNITGSYLTFRWSDLEHSI